MNCLSYLSWRMKMTSGFSLSLSCGWLIKHYLQCKANDRLNCFSRILAFCRTPESWPCLHDVVLAAASDATYSFYPTHNHTDLESLFSSPPFLKPSKAVNDDLGIVELKIGPRSCPLVSLLLNIPLFAVDWFILFRCRWH